MDDYDAFREQVSEWTRGKLEADPVAAASELYPDACEAFPELRDLSVRQYRVRYVVPAAREMVREELEATVGGRATVGEFQTAPPPRSTGDEPTGRTPPGGGETREPSQTEMFAREDGSAT